MVKIFVRVCTEIEMEKTHRAREAKHILDGAQALKKNERMIAFAIGSGGETEKIRFVAITNAVRCLSLVWHTQMTMDG